MDYLIENYQKVIQFLNTGWGTLTLAGAGTTLILYKLVKVSRGMLLAGEGQAQLGQGQWHETAAYDLTTRSEARPAAATKPETQQIAEAESVTEKSGPNLVCTSTDPRPAHIEYGFLLEGHNKYREQDNVAAIVAEITNEFLPARRVADVDSVSAEVIYQSPDGGTTKVRHGSWLNESAYQLNFSVHDSHRLIVAFVSGDERRKEYVFIFTREINNQKDDFINRLALLEGDYYNIKVRLINEAEGIVYKEFDFGLTITREPELDAELIEIKELSPREIRQQLEVFLAEGSNLLMEFPRDKQATPEDIAKVDDWEKRAVRFLGRYPNLFSPPLFLSDFPEVPVAGGAQGGNWPSLKKLSRRLATLREFIDEQRRR